MAEYRNRTTGDIKTQGQLRKENPNISLPRVWNSNVHDALNVDPVEYAPKPTEGIGAYQEIQRNGAVQTAGGEWVQAWVVVDRFQDTTDSDGNVTTKAEHEAAYQQGLDDNAAQSNRSQRDRLIAETDWWASSDLTMTAEQTAYRQALRDITSHANWPHLDAADWPTKP